MGVFLRIYEKNQPQPYRNFEYYWLLILSELDFSPRCWHRVIWLNINYIYGPRNERYCFCWDFTLICRKTINLSTICFAIDRSIKYRKNHCISLLSDLHFFFMLNWSAFCEQCVMDLAWKQPILVLADIAVGVATADRPIHYGCMYSQIQRTMLSLKRKTIFAPPKIKPKTGADDADGSVWCVCSICFCNVHVLFDYSPGLSAHAVKLKRVDPFV